MGFYEEWKHKQAQVVAQRQALIEQAQGCWPGSRVWCSDLFGGWIEGEVERVDASGQVSIVVGYDQDDQPRYYKADVQSLGRAVRLVKA